MSGIVTKAGAAAAMWAFAGGALAQPIGLASLNSPLASPLASPLGSPMGALGSPLGAQAGLAAASGQRPGLLSGVVGCQASGYKQGVGALGGAAAGGLVGNKLLKSNKLAGTLGGAALGGAAGSWVGCRMQQGDQARRVAAARAREDDAGDSDAPGDAPGRTYAQQGGYAQRPAAGRGGGLDGLRFAPRVTPASEYDTAPAGRYVASTVTNLRSAPNTGAEVLARIDPDQQVQVLAAVAGASWVLVGVDGRADGYAYSPNLRAVGRSDQALGCRPVRQTSSLRSDQPAVSQTFEACPQADGGWALRRHAG